MKKACFFLFASMSFGTSVIGQKLTHDEVPQPVVLSFNSLHPEIKKPIWLMEGQGQVGADFEGVAGHETVVFDLAGTVLRKRSVILTREILPGFLQDSLQRYNALEFVRAVRTETPDGCVVFEVDIAQDRVLMTKRFTQGCKPPKAKAKKRSRS